MKRLLTEPLERLTDRERRIYLLTALAWLVAIQSWAKIMGWL